MESGLKIRFWNIIGLSEEKMSDEVFKREINKYDILFLCETWLHRENIINVSYPNGYLCNFVFRSKRRKKGRPSWGWGWVGVLVYFRSEFNKVVSVFDKSNESILWIKIGKSSLNNKSNNYIAFIYNSPKNVTSPKKMNAMFSSL